MWSLSFLLLTGVSHWLIGVYWTILMTMEWIQLEHGVRLCLCILGFGLLIFCWVFLHLYQRYRPVVFFFCSVFVWFWYQGDGIFIEWLLEYFFFILLKYFETDKSLFLYLVEFSSDHLVLDFFSRTPPLFFKLLFYFTVSGWSIQIICFFLTPLFFFFFLGRLFVSRSLSFSSRVYNLLSYNCSKYFLMMFWISVVLVVISPLSFLLLFT